MAIPKNVQKQGEAAEKLAQEHLVAKAPVADKATPPAEAAPAPAKPAPTANDNWEKRFKGLKKTYDNTVTPLRKRITELENQVENLSKAPPAPAASSNLSADDIFSVLTDKEKEDYSPEFLDMVIRLIGRASGGGVDQDVTNRIENLENRTIKSEEDKFWDAINKAHPKWRELQATEDMQAWLLEYDDLLGMSRGDAIARAQSKLDSAKVIAIFNQYSAPVAASITDDPEADLIVPDVGAGDGGVPAGGDQRIWTTDEIRAFYKKAALGGFKGKAGRTEYAQTEKAIEKAREEGRITE